MAQIQDSTKKQRPRTRSVSNFFLNCFGFSESSYKVKENNTNKKMRSSGRLKLGTSWLSSSRKSSDKKADAEKLDQGRKGSFRMVRFSKKFSTTRLDQKKVPANDSSAPRLSQIPAAVGGDEAVHGKANKEKREEKSKKKISLENGNSLTHSDSITKEASTFKKGVFRRNSWSQPTPPPPEEDKSEVRRRSTVALSHSASMPPAPAVASGGAKGGYSEEGHKENESWAGKFDQLVGMSIIVVTLLAVIIWGKLCAILCTSAWLYFYPLIRARKNDPQPRNGTKTKSLDLVIDSQKHKKKVVFEGFLERNHRIN